MKMGSFAPRLLTITPANGAATTRSVAPFTGIDFALPDTCTWPTATPSQCKSKQKANNFEHSNRGYERHRLHTSLLSTWRGTTPTFVGFRCCSDIGPYCNSRRATCQNL